MPEDPGKATQDFGLRAEVAGLYGHWNFAHSLSEGGHGAAGLWEQTDWYGNLVDVCRSHDLRVFVIA